MGYAPQASAETCAMTSIVVLGVSTPSAGSSGAGTDSLACGVNNSTTGNTTVAVGTNNVASGVRSEEHTSELQSLMRISYAVFCLKKKKKDKCNNDMSQKHNSTHTSEREYN